MTPKIDKAMPHIGILLIILIPIFCFSMVYAETESALSMLMSGDFNAKAKKTRSKIANDVLSKVSDLAKQLPKPSPSEIEWVTEENAAIKAIDSTDVFRSRVDQLFKSPEFHHVRIFNQLTTVRDSLQCVMDSAELKREMLCWSVAAFHLGKTDALEDGLKVLTEAKRLPSSSHKGFAALCEFYARGIQEYLIIPYLRGDLE